MENRSYALLTGCFLLALSAAVVVAATWLSNSGEERKPYIVVTEGSVSGLNVQSTVRYRGVNVGKVTEIRFAPGDFEHIWIRIEVDADLPLTDTTYAQLQAQGITGLSRLELSDENGKRGKPVKTSEADPARIPMHPSLIQEAGDIAESLLDDADKLLKNLNAILGPGSAHRLDRIFDNIEQATDGILRIERKLEPTLDQLPGLARNANSAIRRIDGIAKELQGIGGKLQRTAENAEHASKAGQTAGEQLSGETLPRVNRLLEQLNATVAELHTLSRQLERDPQSLLYGPSQPPPGPGESGYRESSP